MKNFRYSFHYLVILSRCAGVGAGAAEEEVDILMAELFQKFNVSGTGEFEFEEFRDFFVK